LTLRGRNLLTRVEELIDPTMGQWDVELITQTFVEEDVKIILSIPVHLELDDVVAWHYDNRSLFSVRSTYKLQKEYEKHISRRGEQSTSHGTDVERDMWKSLCKLECLGKIKHLLWRFAHNSLALRMGLERRDMDSLMLKMAMESNNFELAVTGGTVLEIKADTVFVCV
jgi:hypothetical protein